jgi:hypothetical protein
MYESQKARNLCDSLETKRIKKFLFEEALGGTEWKMQ